MSERRLKQSGILRFSKLIHTMCMNVANQITLNLSHVMRNLVAEGEY